VQPTHPSPRSTRRPASTGAPLARHEAAIFGGLLAGGSIALAWGTGAGVLTSATSPASGPTSTSLLLLALALVLLGAGARLISAYGSRYVGDAETEAISAGPSFVRAWRDFPQLAIFLGTFGSGLLLIGLALPLTPALGISHGPLPLYIQPSVTWVPTSLIGAGVATLVASVGLFAAARRSSPLAAAAWWRRTGRFVAAVTVAVLAITAPCLTVPVAQTYSSQLHTYSGGAGAFTFTSFPQGVSVRGTWSTSPVEIVNFTVEGDGYNLTQTGESGSFSFTASGTPVPSYTFSVSTRLQLTVTVTCQFLAPLWGWPPGEPGAPTTQ
jgi:hypothetical protein